MYSGCQTYNVEVALYAKNDSAGVICARLIHVDVTQSVQSDSIVFHSHSQLSWEWECKEWKSESEEWRMKSEVSFCEWCTSSLTDFLAQHKTWEHGCWVYKKHLKHLTRWVFLEHKLQFQFSLLGTMSSCACIVFSCTFENQSINCFENRSENRSENQEINLELN